MSVAIDNEPGGTSEIVVRTRADEGVAWDESGTTVIESDESTAEMQFTAGRLVQVEQTVTGADTEGGVTGVADLVVEEEEEE